MQKVKSWDEIVSNCVEFNKAMRDTNTVASRRFSQFYHWFYFPHSKLFAPSKFIGYTGTNANNYSGAGTGTETNQVLSKYFTKLDRNSKSFNSYFKLLQAIAKSLNKTLSQKLTDGTGGIYLPKSEFVKIEKSKYHELIAMMITDLDAQKEEDDYSPAFEGSPKQKYINYYERNPKLRAKAITIHGLTCMGCDANFERIYGEWGKNFIEVHHLKPIRRFNKAMKVNPATDMTVLCPNCHRMVHRKKNKVLSIEELKKIITKSK